MGAGPLQEIKDCALDMTQSTHVTRGSSNNAPVWPVCPWCTRALAVLDRDPIAFTIRYTCLARPCVCYGLALSPETGEVAA